MMNRRLGIFLGSLALGWFSATRAGIAPIGDAWSDPRNPIVTIFQGQRLDLWSLKPLKPDAVPEVMRIDWVRGNLDRFILARLESEGLSPSPEAGRRTLARRLSFDLTGLPPTPEDVAALVANTSPEAYAQFVERLLASPRFGEHWARLWLDIVRYSDSNGYDWDEFRPEAWRFRDYVVRTFNADKPFDRFVIEQLAGDELLAGPPREAAEQDALIATGYLRAGPQDNSSKLFNEQPRSRNELMTDLAETTGAAFLGLTLACCRCHDHKTEPLAQVDHYRLRAFFEATAYADDLALDLAPEQEALRRNHAAVEAEKAPFESARAALLAEVKECLKFSGNANPSDDDARRVFSTNEKAREQELTKQIKAVEAKRRPFTRGLFMSDGANSRDKPPVTHVLLQGDYRQPTEVVQPGFPSILDPNPAVLAKPVSPQTTGRRLTLARWIVSPENPLTARVFVNRAWQALFGRGLVATPNDFGLSGARPTHPQLLDWLAAEFVRGGWSIKTLVRKIVMSATYQQASAATGPGTQADGDNTLMWRQNLRRLSAEPLRDALLVTAGLLRHCDGGPPVWPALPPEVLTANPALLDDNETRTKGWYPSPPEQQNVRSLFLIQKRTVRVPFMETFDLPENATSCARRTVSTVAPQALSLMNAPQTLEVAGAFARRVERTVCLERELQVGCAFQFALQRDPTDAERARGLIFLESRSLDELCRVLVNLNEFVYVE